MFDRMANGNVAPLRKIGGPLTGALGAFRQLKVDSERGMVYLAVQSYRRASATPQKAADLYTNEASLKKLRDARGARRRRSRRRAIRSRRPASSARGASTTTATCRRARSSAGRRSARPGLPASRSAPSTASCTACRAA